MVKTPEPYATRHLYRFVADCLEEVRAGGKGEDLTAEVLEPVYLKKPERNRYSGGDYDDEGGDTGYGMSFADLDDDEPDAIDAVGAAGASSDYTDDEQLEWPRRVTRAKMFAQDKWRGAEEFVIVRDFVALYKMCLEPIGKLVTAQGLENIQLDPQQLSVSWTYEDKSKPAGEPDKDPFLLHHSALGFC